MNQNFAYRITSFTKNDTEKPSAQKFETALLSNAEYRRSYHTLPLMYVKDLKINFINQYNMEN